MQRFTSRFWAGSIVAVVVGAIFGIAAVASAQGGSASDAPFSLQVSPSPLVLTIKPGEQRDTELQVRNTGPAAEKLVMGLRAFTVDEAGEVTFKDTPPDLVKDWVSFASPEFSLAPGEVFTQKISLAIPKEAGFSYNFAITITRANQTAKQAGTQSIRGTLAVFTLLSIDKPGATRGFEIDGFSSLKRMYEYVPANLDLKLRNSGNTIVQPIGNVYISRAGSNEPITVLPLNPNSSYILPSSGRIFNYAWDDGFPAYVEHKDADNVAPTRQLKWDWSKLGHFRIGRYTAKVVAVYNDGHHDIPVRAEVSFWVVPWKLLLGGFVVVLLLGTGAYVVVRRFLRAGKAAAAHRKQKRHHDTEPTDNED